jgi:hypothetical protein
MSREGRPLARHAAVVLYVLALVAVVIGVDERGRHDALL